MARSYIRMASSSVSLVDCLHCSSYIAGMKADYCRYIAEFKDKGAELAEVSSSLVPKVQRLNLLR